MAQARQTGQLKKVVELKKCRTKNPKAENTNSF